MAGLLAGCTTFAGNENGNRELVFSDEFSENGVPNPAKWDFEHGFERNEELQWYQPENAYCQNGMLIIEGKKEIKENPKYDPNSKNWKFSRKNAEYTSASVITKPAINLKRGSLEVRARIPFGKGAWPAIWLLPDNFRHGNKHLWPASGEIDILEYYRINKVPHILANFAWEGADDGAKWNAKKIPLSYFQQKDSDWLANFHIWRMDWDEKTIKIFLDGELLNEMDLSKAVNEGKNKGKVVPFEMPQYLILNLALGGFAGGPVDADAMPMKYEIDYVRIYKVN